jgi:hypothetical protein
MPRKLINDYIFYKFVCNDESIECCYVGSTANFSDRKRNHKSSCNNSNDKHYTIKIYQTIRENGGWENWKMVIIGEAKEISLIQSRILEQKYIDELKANMNARRAYTTKEDILEDNKKYCKKHYEKYKEHILNKTKEYREANKDKIEEWKEANKDRLKEYQKEYNKQYYLKKKQEKKV